MPVSLESGACTVEQRSDRSEERCEMYILRIEHGVPDYESWKAVFDRDPIGRERSGVARYRVMRER